MEDLATLTDKDGELFPSKIVSSSVKPPVLKIVQPDPKSNPTASLRLSLELNLEDFSYSTSSEDDTDCDEEGFYVEFGLPCTTEEGETEERTERTERTVIFNFGTEDEYIDHAETGFGDMECYFGDAISLNYPEWQ